MADQPNRVADLHEKYRELRRLKSEIDAEVEDLGMALHLDEVFHESMRKQSGSRTFAAGSYLAEIDPGRPAVYLGALAASTPLVEWIEQVYFPHCLPGLSHESSRGEHLFAAGNLGKGLAHAKQAADEAKRPFPLPFDGVARVSDLTEDSTAVMVEWMLSLGRSPATVNKTVRHLKAVARFAREEKRLPLPPFRPRPLRELKREPEAWSTKELAAIAHAAAERTGWVGGAPAGHWWEALVLVLMSTGLRVTALMRAPTANYDRQRRELLVGAEDQKHRADQRMELLSSAAAAIERLAPWDRHLPTIFGDWGLCESTLRRSLRLLLVESGLFASVDAIPPHRNAFHKFRRSFATQVAATAGRDAARELLGHSTPTVTDRYIDRRYVPRRSITTLVKDPLASPAPPPASEESPDA